MLAINRIHSIHRVTVNKHKNPSHIMSLYDGLDIENKSYGKGPSSADVAGWSSSYKLLQSQLQAKKVSNAPAKKNRSGRLAPVVDLKKTIETDYGLQFDHVTGKLHRAKNDVAPSRKLSGPALPFITSSAPAASITGVENEYDPLHPNEYDDIIKQRQEEKERVLEEERLKQADEDRKKRYDRMKNSDDNDRGDYRRERRDESDMDRSRRRREEEEDMEYERAPRRGGGSSGAAIAPPQALIENDTTNASLASETAPKQSSGSVASKIMAKYGYKHGQGLGKSEQGMSIALQIEKTSKRGGKIIHERDLFKSANPEPQQQSNTNLLKNPSKVILLQNMVGPGEVDDDLEPETGEECAKYGKVMKVTVIEVPDVPDESAVRIFVEFERMEAAIKALVDLNGRFFGGRAVRGCFYNLDKFRRMDFLDDVDFD